MEKLLTIAIPTYNRKNFLKRALDSILCQNDDCVEILVSDNASDDGTQEMMRSEYPQIRYSRNDENIGGEANFLKCYKLASGKFVLLLGSDDVVIEDSLKTILDFLEANQKCSLVFMNHAFFVGEYIDLAHCKKIFLNKSDTFTTADKQEFMSYAGEQITLMSCLILSKKCFESVDKPEQYIWTYFLHTNIALETTKKNDSLFGIIGKPCIADNITTGDSEVEKDISIIFKVFGRGMEYTFCTHAPQCGYDYKQMKKIYLKTTLYKWSGKIIGLKLQNNDKWKKEFYEYGYPVLKKYPTAFVLVMPALIVPKWLAKFLQKYIRPIFRRLNGNFVFDKK